MQIDELELSLVFTSKTSEEAEDRRKQIDEYIDIVLYLLKYNKVVFLGTSCIKYRHSNWWQPVLQKQLSDDELSE